MDLQSLAKELLRGALSCEYTRSILGGEHKCQFVQNATGSVRQHKG